MSIARRETKWMIACLSCALQASRPTQRYTAPPVTVCLPRPRLTSWVRSTAEPHTGQCSGICTGRASAGRRSVTTCMTWGMTSPARRMITVSPIITPRRCTSSMLCRVALDTVTPATCTGRSRATGVTAPVRPTWNSTSSNSVISSLAGNLWAMAQRGSRARKPSSRCQPRSLTLNTKALHFVHVMQGGIGYRHPGHLHRAQSRYRGNRAGAADLEFHIQQLGHLLAGGKLVGDGPARLTGAEAELALPAQIIDLEHHTIYLVGQTAASLADVPVVVQAAVD